jgi:hypothetical protein
MKKILLAFSISLVALSASAKITVVEDTAKLNEELLIEKMALSPVLNDTFVNNVSLDLQASKLTPKQDSAIVEQADLIVQAVSSVVPSLKPYTSILGFLTTTIGYLIVHVKWRRKHRKELENLKPNN